jgi:hydrogenase maturation protease
VTSPVWTLLDDDTTPRCDTLVIGCGNLLRGDDAAGPVLIQRLWQLPRVTPGLTPGPASGDAVERIRLLDGGTSGMAVAFQMRHANRCVLVDACLTGAPPGTIYQVPADEVASLPEVRATSSHDFRWDHAIAFGRWLLGPLMPADIVVYLIEAGATEFGEPLTPAVSAAVDTVAARILAETDQEG